MLQLALDRASAGSPLYICSRPPEWQMWYTMRKAASFGHKALASVIKYNLRGAEPSLVCRKSV